MSEARPEVEEETNLEGKFFNTVEKVLGSFYHRSVERLQLKIAPTCYNNPLECFQSHQGGNGSNQEIIQATQEVISECRTLKNTQDFDNLFSRIDNICVSGSFPGVEIMTLLLEIILETPVESPEFIINRSLDQFNGILTQFPPCILQLNSTYSTLLSGKCVLGCLEDHGDKESGLLTNIINLIENLLEDSDKAEGVNPKNLQNLPNPEKQEDFKLLPSIVRLDRLFVILNLLVKILEFDLVMWILRYPVKTSTFMLDPEVQPLVGKVFWPSGDFPITFFMKKVLSVFVEMIFQEFQGFQMEIFERFVCLMSNAVNLCEIQTSSQVQFPCIGQKSKDLVERLMQIIEDYDSDESLTLHVLQHVSNPITKMLMMDNVFSNITPTSDSTAPVSITKILHIFRGKEWILQNRIPQLKYVQLFMETMQCWLDVYRLHEVMGSFADECENPEGDQDGGCDCGIIRTEEIAQIYLDEMKSVLKLHRFLVKQHGKYPVLFASWIQMIEQHFGFALRK